MLQRCNKKGLLTRFFWTSCCTRNSINNHCTWRCFGKATVSFLLCEILWCNIQMCKKKDCHPLLNLFSLTFSIDRRQSFNRDLTNTVWKGIQQEMNYFIWNMNYCKFQNLSQPFHYISLNPSDVLNTFEENFTGNPFHPTHTHIHFLQYENLRML